MQTAQALADAKKQLTESLRSYPWFKQCTTAWADEAKRSFVLRVVHSAPLSVATEKIPLSVNDIAVRLVGV